MPIYEFMCDDCKEEFESLVFGGDDVSCPVCNGKSVKKLISTCSFKRSGGESSSSASSSGCNTCSSKNCSTCH